MDLIYDFSGMPGNDTPYGGNAGLKKGFFWNGENWFLKFPKSTKDFKNVEISYTTSPLSEYIGSQIYQQIGIPVHDTRLGVYRNKSVVACKNFLKPGENLYEFRELKNIYSDELEEYEQHTSSSGMGTELETVIKIIETNPVLREVPGVKERFWDMFVTDAFMGNNDRNNGNWGVIYGSNGERQLSPVYDNGNSFRNKASDRQLMRTLADITVLENSAYKAQISIFTTNSGKMINPFDVISGAQNEDCNGAVKRIVPKIDLQGISKMINRIPETFQGVKLISSVQKEYFNMVLQKRYEDVLKPTLQNIQEQERQMDAMKACMKRTSARRPGGKQKDKER